MKRPSERAGGWSEQACSTDFTAEPVDLRADFRAVGAGERPPLMAAGERLTLETPAGWLSETAAARFSTTGNHSGGGVWC